VCKVWFARCLIGIVLFFNLQCAFAFVWQAQFYAPGFDLDGVSGEAMLRGMGILFIMWNVPYAIAVLHPLRYRVSLIEAVIMQAIGVSGESLLLLSMHKPSLNIQTSLGRFIAFDGAGLVLLLAALILVSHRRESDVA